MAVFKGFPGLKFQKVKFKYFKHFKHLVRTLYVDFCKNVVFNESMLQEIYLWNAHCLTSKTLHGLTYL